MSREKLIYNFSFENANRNRITLSDPSKIRLNPETNRIELKRQSWDPVTGQPIYPTGELLTARTWIANPAALIAWSGFYCEPRNSSLPANTDLKFRISDGIDDYFWNASLPAPTWEIADDEADWSSHSTVAAHINSFPVASGKLGVVVGLSTTDPANTPWVEFIDIGMVVEIEWLYSLIAGSVIPELREQLVVSIDFAVDAPGGLKISLLDIETPFNISSVTAVYDQESDPHHRTNLLSAYDSVDKTISLSTPIERGTTAWIVFQVEPEILVNWGNQDYIEVEKIPAAVIDNVSLTAFQNIATQSIINVNSNKAIVRKRPLRLNIQFNVLLFAEKTRTLLAMMDAINKFILMHPELNWRDLDQPLSLRRESGPALALRPALGDKHQATVGMRLENTYIWIAPEEEIPLVERLNCTLNKI